MTSPWSIAAAALRPSEWGRRLWGSTIEGAFIRTDRERGGRPVLVLTVAGPGGLVVYELVGIAENALC
ncbi:hypothetical protein [Parafrankia discariae]|uniref:hypothetical protein n=1 Tax=Parafrankia discariae TaxID=365528 RepID=UPI00037AFAB1|nr:hypothetical protein [Parafrankia discariae]